MQPQVRIGFQSVETYVLMLAGVLGGVIPNFPQHAASFGPILIWALGRLAEKILGPAAPEKRSWQTPEFWINIGATILAALDPNGAVIVTIGFGVLTVGIVLVRVFSHVQIGGTNVVSKP